MKEWHQHTWTIDQNWQPRQSKRRCRCLSTLSDLHKSYKKMFCSDLTLCPLPLCHHIHLLSWQLPHLLDAVWGSWGVMNNCSCGFIFFTFLFLFYLLKTITCFPNADDLVNLLLVVHLIQYKCVHLSNFSFSVWNLLLIPVSQRHSCIPDSKGKKKREKRDSGPHLQTKEYTVIASGHGSQLGLFTVKQGGLDGTSAF